MAYYPSGFGAWAKRQGAEPCFHYMSASVASSSGLPGSSQDGGPGISTRRGFFAHLTAHFCRTPKPQATWRTHKEPLAELDPSPIFSILALNLPCMARPGISPLFLFLWDSELSAWKHNWGLALPIKTSKNYPSLRKIYLKLHGDYGRELCSQTAWVLTLLLCHLLNIVPQCGPWKNRGNSN